MDEIRLLFALARHYFQEWRQCKQIDVIYTLLPDMKRKNRPDWHCLYPLSAVDEDNNDTDGWIIPGNESLAVSVEGNNTWAAEWGLKWAVKLTFLCCSVIDLWFLSGSWTQLTVMNWMDFALNSCFLWSREREAYLALGTFGTVRRMDASLHH